MYEIIAFLPSISLQANGPRMGCMSLISMLDVHLSLDATGVEGGDMKAKIGWYAKWCILYGSNNVAWKLKLPCYKPLCFGFKKYKVCSCIKLEHHIGI